MCFAGIRLRGSHRNRRSGAKEPVARMTLRKVLDLDNEWVGADRVRAGLAGLAAVAHRLGNGHFCGQLELCPKLKAWTPSPLNVPH